MEKIASVMLAYQWQTELLLGTAMVVTIFGLAVYGLYRLIIWRMGKGTKTVFQRYLVLAGISLLVFLFLEMTVSLITIHQVSRQLGFHYATPETPEGEPFLITKVIPGKAMDQGGLRANDEIRMRNVNDLYLLMIKNQGKETFIPILRDKKEIEIRVQVPQMKVPLAKVSFLF